MKFVHISDIHLGKTLHQYNLIENQKYLLFQLLDYMNEQDIKLLVIAGDVYDRSTPSQEAVNLLDEFISSAILKYNIKILMISGNHDSSDRLHFASSLLKENGLHIETHLKKEMPYVEIEDTRFYMLPFVKPGQIRMMFDQDVHTFDEALRYYLSLQEIDKEFKNVLITHQFVGHQSIVSDSEVPISVGGTEVIQADIFDDFDYVALGHLHAPQHIQRETIRYSGSLMRYSFDEVKQKKSIVVVDTDDFSYELYSLNEKQSVNLYKGTFEQFMDRDFIENKEDLLSFELEDTSLIPHAIEQLRVLYPNLLQITYSFIFEKSAYETNLENVENMDHNELFSHFYKEMKNMELDESQRKIINELFEQVGDINETD